MTPSYPVLSKSEDQYVALVLMVSFLQRYTPEHTRQSSMTRSVPLSGVTQRDWSRLGEPRSSRKKETPDIVEPYRTQLFAISLVRTQRVQTQRLACPDMRASRREDARRNRAMHPLAFEIFFLLLESVARQKLRMCLNQRIRHDCIGIGMSPVWLVVSSSSWKMSLDNFVDCLN